MGSGTRICTCQKYCQAPPEGRAIPTRTWYDHAAQHELEAGMGLEERATQQSQVRKRQRQVGWSYNKVSNI